MLHGKTKVCLQGLRVQGCKVMLTFGCDITRIHFNHGKVFANGRSFSRSFSLEMTTKRWDENKFQKLFRRDCYRTRATKKWKNFLFLQKNVKKYLVATRSFWMTVEKAFFYYFKTLWKKIARFFRAICREWHGRILIIGPGLHTKSDCTKGGLYSWTWFIYRYKTSTLTPFIKPRIN